MADVLNSETRSLAGLASETDEHTVLALISDMLIEVAEYLNVGKNFTGKQIAITADLIYEDFKVYKPEYLKLFFRRFMKGEFGELYDRVDGQSILLSLRSFGASYEEEVAHTRTQQKKKLESTKIPVGAYTELPPLDMRPVPMPENVKELIKNIGAPLDQRYTEYEMVEDDDPTRNALALQRQKIGEFAKEFHDLYDAGSKKKDGSTARVGGVEFLKIGESHLSLQEYIKHKFYTLK